MFVHYRTSSPRLLLPTYSNHGLGTRVGKTENSVSNTFRRSGAYVTDPVLGDGTASYTPGISVRSGGNVRYQHTGLKNTDSQTSPVQSVAASRVYDAFGNVVSSSGTWTGPFGYAGNFGYQHDASGLKLLGHRYYDPSTGRFLTRDPIKDGRNWYAYGSGQGAPTNFTDPDGLEPVPGRTPPPVPVPGGGSDNGWKWVPNAKYNPENPKSRPGKWVPKTGVKGTKGGQPSASWDRVHDHWDVDDGQGNRNRYDKNGKFLPHEEAHKPTRNRAGASGAKESHASPATHALGLFTRLGGLLGLLFTPTNMNAPSCLGMRHDLPMCTGCGHICTEPSKKSDPPRKGRKG